MNRVNDSNQDLEENKMSSAQPTIPPDDPKRSPTLAQLENLPYIGLVGDTYTITVTGEQTAGRFCVIDMHIPPGGGPPPHRHDFEETFILLEGQMETTSVARIRPSAPAGDSWYCAQRFANACGPSCGK
jgi:quercetin dioxygenase-like cupin family protein